MKPSPSRLVLLSAVITAALACIVSPLYAAQPTLGYATRAEVVRVVDGDTIEVRITHIVHVRLLDCWAPELRSKSDGEKLRAELAKKHAERLTVNRHGVLFVPTDGASQIGDVLTFGRVLGHFYPDGHDKSLSEMMVESGYATEVKP